MRRVLLLLAGVGLLSLIPVLAWAAPSNGNWFSSTSGHGEVVNMDGDIWQFNFETMEDGSMFGRLAMFEDGAEEPTCDASTEAGTWSDQGGTVTVDLPVDDLAPCFDQETELVSAQISIHHDLTKKEKSDGFVDGAPCRTTDRSDDHAAASVMITSTAGVEVDLTEGLGSANYFMIESHCPGNPFVGSWENDDLDGSHQRLQIAASGQFQYRDDRTSGTICSEPSAFRAIGRGELIQEGNPIFLVTLDGRCGKDDANFPVDAEFVYERADRLRMSDDSCWYRTGSDPNICLAEINDDLQCDFDNEVAILTINNIGDADLDVHFSSGEIVFDEPLPAGESVPFEVMPFEPWSWTAEYQGVFVDGQDGEGPPCAEMALAAFTIVDSCDPADPDQSIVTFQNTGEGNLGFQVEIEDELIDEFELAPGELPDLLGDVFVLQVPSDQEYGWQAEFQGFPLADDERVSVDCPLSPA